MGKPKRLPDFDGEKNNWENMPSVDDPLPELIPESVDIPGADGRFYQDLYNDSGEVPLPGEVAADVAQMPSMETPADQGIPETGMRFDFSSLRVQSPEDFAALPEEQKELLRAMKRGVQFTEESAAKFVLQQRERQQRVSDQSATPQGRLAERKIEQMDKETMLARRDTMTTAQSMLDAASRIEGALEKGLVGPWKDVEQKFDGSGLPLSDPEEYSERKALEVQTKKSIVDAVQAFKGPLSDSDRRFFIEMFPTINEPKGVWKDYAAQLKKKFSPIVEGNFDMPTAAQPQQQQQPSGQQAPLPTKKVGNQTWVRKPEGWVPQQ